ncbi:autotransporter outer membrane beta-barrel domain-containing protein [Caulobacter soli]|uniref:autotransporter outer membrane beta-barrel domain-containing protein n=1 Tax=Caulobacter soli TaxID=2708539 RepID=UPI0013EDF6B0|nr:autotransporter outer membrane beta-barrel domain-containing protein [Caulobacter soli]
MLLGTTSIATFGFGGLALAQTCPTPAVANGASCTVPPGTIINVTTANGVGASASGTGGAIDASGVTIRPAAAGATAALAQSGAAITLNNAVIDTNSVGAAATNQRGARAVGLNSTIAANGAAIDMTTASGTASNMVGVSAEDQALIALSATRVSMSGGGNGTGNYALQAVGAGSRISFVGGEISTNARGALGVRAVDGGLVTLSGGTQITTAGAQNTTTLVGSHALIASGATSQITGSGIFASTSGTLANGARAELGGKVDLVSSTLTTTGAGTTTDPSAAARVVSGGRLTMSGAGGAITATGQFGHGLSVQDAGSLADIGDTVFTVTGNRAIGANITLGGEARVRDSTIVAPSAVIVDGAGSKAAFTDSAIRATGAVGYGIRAVAGAVVTVSGGSITTELRDAAGLFAASSTVTATNVAVLTLGPDTAIGVLADLGSTITLQGGRVETRGDSVRASSYPHGLTARNPGALLVANDTSVDTYGLTAMGAVSDDGGSLRLTNNVIHTRGAVSLGLYATVEQAGAQFPADVTGTGLTVTTEGNDAYGAQAQQHFLEAPATVNLKTSTITTSGARAAGLRALSGGTVVAERTTVTTSGALAHGVVARNAPSSVTLRDQSRVTTSGPSAHGAVAENGGRVDAFGSTVTASGTGASGLFVLGETARSAANLSDGGLSNMSGPTIAVAGAGTISLTNMTVGGSGEWLRVATIDDFAPIAGSEPILTGPADQPEDDTPIAPLSMSAFAAAPAAVAGAAVLTISDSTLEGSAYTAPGSTSDVTLAADTTWTMTGSSNLTNLANDASSILFAAPTQDADQLASYMTLTTVNYTGAAGLIGLNTYLGHDGSPSDRLVIDGGAGTGTSSLRITRAGGLGALTQADGILVVDARGGATTATDLFTLAGPVVAGPYEYGLFRGGAGASDSWFLRSRLDCAAANAPSPPCPPPDPTPPDPTPPDPTPPDPTPTPDTPAFIRSEVSLYTALPALAQLYGRAAIDTLHERVGEEEQLRGRQQPDDDETLNGVWGRIMAIGGRRDGDSRGIYGDRGPRMNYQLYALQAGVDLYRREDEDGIRDHAGVYGAFGRAKGKVRNWDGQVAGRDQVDAWSLGAYWTRFWEKGAYLDGVVQFTWFDAKAQSVRLPALKGDAKALALSLEGGKPFHQKHDWIIEPQAQLIYQHFHGGKGRDEGGPVRFDQTDSLVGRLGARVARTWLRETDGGETRLTTGWGRLNLWHEFLDQPKTTFQTEDADISFLADTGETWLELNGGLTRQMSDRSVLYFNASYSWDLDGRGYGYSGKLGVRFNW